MVQTSKPWNLTSPGDAGPYSAEQWAAFWRSTLIGNLAANYNRGVISRTGDVTNSPLSVAVTVPATNQVRIYAGEAIVAGWHYISDAQELVLISSNLNPNPRITTIVLRLTAADQEVRLAAKNGTAAASPVAPTLTQDITTVFEIPLADVTVPAGYNSSTDTIASGITDRRISGILLPLEHGGVGIDALVSPYSEGQIIIASSANELIQSPAMIDYGIFVGNTNNPGNIDVISQRPHKLKGPHAATWAVQRPANSANGTLIVFNSAEMYNPDGYITNLAANLWRLQAGTYLVSGVLNIGNELNTTAFQCQWWIANNSAPSVYLVQAPEIYVGPNGSSGGGSSVHAVMIEEELVSTGAEDFGLRFRSFAAGGASNLSLDGSTGVQYVLSFRRIQ
jgi:hypothetical protein